MNTVCRPDPHFTQAECWSHKEDAWSNSPGPTGFKRVCLTTHSRVPGRSVRMIWTPLNTERRSYYSHIAFPPVSESYR